MHISIPHITTWSVKGLADRTGGLFCRSRVARHNRLFCRLWRGGLICEDRGWAGGISKLCGSSDQRLAGICEQQFLFESSSNASKTIVSVTAVIQIRVGSLLQSSNDFTPWWFISPSAYLPFLPSALRVSLGVLLLMVRLLITDIPYRQFTRFLKTQLLTLVERGIVGLNCATKPAWSYRKMGEKKNLGASANRD